MLPPEPDFLVRTKARPDELIDAEAFVALRAGYKPQKVTRRFTDAGADWTDSKLYDKTNTTFQVKGNFADGQK